MNAILVIVGPSGVGKTTVANRVVERDPSFEFVRSATTRAPRGDGNDSEYIYLTREEVLGRVESGKMLEYMEKGLESMEETTQRNDKLDELLNLFGFIGL